jgi:hypothetical protein
MFVARQGKGERIVLLGLILFDDTYLVGFLKMTQFGHALPQHSVS